MWARMNDPDIWEKLCRSCRPDERDVLARLIADASRMPWASEVTVVTSLGALRLTTQQAYEAGSNAGSVHLTVSDSGDVVLAYVPRDATASAVELTRPPDDSVGGLELVLMHLFADQESHAIATSGGAVAKGEEFEIGARVRVVLNHSNRTPHTGIVAQRIWHHKLQCWTYFLVDGTKAIKKRYLCEDLERLP